MIKGGVPGTLIAIWSDGGILVLQPARKWTCDLNMFPMCPLSVSWKISNPSENYRLFPTEVTMLALKEQACLLHIKERASEGPGAESTWAVN